MAASVTLPAEPLAKDDGERKTGHTGVDVNGGATCEVDRLQGVGDPPADMLVEAEVEDPGGRWGSRPMSPRLPRRSARLRTWRDQQCSRDQGNGDDGKHGLEGDEGHRGQACSRVLHQTLEA